MSIKLGLGLPQQKHFTIGRDVPAVAKAAEEVGYDGLWVFERTLFPTPMTQGLYGMPGVPWPEHYRSVADPLVCLSLAAAVTSRARLGTSVLVAPYHLPFQLARSLASLDDAAGGRVVLGVGTGWSADEYRAGSIAPFSRRGAVLDELLDVCAAVWGPDPVSYEGEWTTIAPAEVGPKPARPIPIFLPASSGRAVRRLIERGDGYMPNATGASRLAADCRRIRDLAAEAGRERPIEVCVRANVRYGRRPYEGPDRRPFHGDLDQVVEDLIAHAEVDGVTEILLDVQSQVGDAEELMDVAADLYTRAREAGV